MASENLNDDFDYGKIIEEHFEGNDWHFSIRRRENRTLFALPMSAKNCPGLNVKLDVSDNGDSKIRCYLAEDTPVSVHDELLEVLNTLNGRYRYITLSLDSDGDILAAYDFDLEGYEGEAIGRHAGQMVVLLSDIMDKCIPPIMKVVWSAEEYEEEEEDEE